MKEQSITRFAWLSIGTALIILFLKTIAYFLTGSVGLLSDALESVAILVSAITALFMLRLAEKPPDDDHLYGHTKAEYFSSIVEGAFILVISFSIGTAAINRLFHPQPIEQPFIGLAVASIGTILNAVIAFVLLREGKKNNSITLEADGQHLMTDVWTSLGIIAGVALVSLTKIQILDPIIALLVACFIIVTGLKIMKKSVLGLMDTSLPDSEIKKINTILLKYCSHGVSFHGLRSRQSASRKFMSVHILVPGNWSVQKGHDLLEKIEKDINQSFSKMTVLTHLEPIEDPKSADDISIDRKFAKI